MLKTSMTAILLASSFVPAAAPASAMQAIVTQVDKNKDGTMTYHYAIEVDKGETLVPGEAKKGDFVTIYNFYGFVEGSAKTPAGWTFSSEEFGRTPTANGYPLVLPLDVPNTPNLTWTAAKPVASGSRVDGFSATTRVGDDGFRRVCRPGDPHHPFRRYRGDRRAGTRPAGCDRNGAGTHVSR